MSRSDQVRERLTAYGQQLRAAGFRVWLTNTTGGGYLTYEMNGFYGTFQRSEFEGWNHHMPLVPSREFGSSMYVGDADDWSVEAALTTAREFNTNPVVGRQRNAGERAWVSKGSREL